MCVVDGVQYYVNGNSRNNRRVTVVVPLQGSKLTAAMRTANEAMAKARVTVKWSDKEVKLFGTTVYFKWKMRVREAIVGSVYIAAMLLHNMRGCLYPNQVSQYLGCSAPSLKEYPAHKD